jgi:hypothetical protein
MFGQNYPLALCSVEEFGYFCIETKIAHFPQKSGNLKGNFEAEKGF